MNGVGINSGGPRHSIDLPLFELLVETRRKALELIDAFKSKERARLDLAPLRAVVTDNAPEFNVDSSLKQLRSSLMALLGDVDHIIITFPLTTSKAGIGLDLSTQKFSVALQALNTEDAASSLKVVTISGKTSAMQDIVQERISMVVKLGFPAHTYRDPAIMTLVSDKGFYLGGIALFRGLTASPISDSTLRLLEELRPILTQMAINFIAKYRLENDAQTILSRVAQDIVIRGKLSRAEIRVLLLLLFGCSYAEIASDLDITINTVRKHVKSIHAKAGVSSTVELYARFVARRLA